MAQTSGGLAQLGARLVSKHTPSQIVLRQSIPNKKLHPRGSLLGFYGGLAQLGERLHGMQEVTGSIPVISIPRHFTRNREVLFILSASKCITILQILCKIKVEVRRNVQDAALIIGTFAGKYLEPIKHNMHKITGICQKCLRRNGCMITIIPALPNT